MRRRQVQQLAEIALKKRGKMQTERREMSGVMVATFYFLGFVLFGFIIIIATKGI